MGARSPGEHIERKPLMNDRIDVSLTDPEPPSLSAGPGQSTARPFRPSLRLTSLMSLLGAILLVSAVWLPWFGYASIRGWDLLTALVVDPYAGPFLPGLWATVLYLGILGYFLLTSGLTLLQPRLRPSRALDRSLLAVGALVLGFLLWFFKWQAQPGYWSMAPWFLLLLAGRLWRAPRATSADAILQPTPPGERMKPFEQGCLLAGLLPVGLEVLAGWFLIVLVPFTFEVWVAVTGYVYLGCLVGLILLAIVSRQQRRRELTKGIWVGLSACTGIAICFALILLLSYL